MTTNVLDRKCGRITSDSRWSINDGGSAYVYYVDDTGFDKIVERASAVMICAGDAKLIDAWKNWFTDPNPSYLAPQSQVIGLNGNVIAEVAVTIISKPHFGIEFSRGNYESFEDAAHFCGTGGLAAKDCYSINGCSLRCVDSAKELDLCTGGEVKFYDIATFNNNLSNPKATLRSMYDQLVGRGLAVNKQTKEVIPMDPLKQDELRQALANGTLSVSAPTGTPLRAWTDREIHDVQETMKRIVEREKAANS